MAYGVMASQAMPIDSRERVEGAIIKSAQSRVEQALEISSRLKRILDALRPAPPEPAEGGFDKLLSSRTLMELMESIQSHHDRSVAMLSEIESLIG
jgi:hypothetical protein